MTDQPRNLPPIKLSIEEDSTSFSRVEQRASETFSRITALAKANDAVAQSAQQMGRTLHDAFAQGATQVDANTRSVQALRKEVQGLGSDQQKAGGGGVRVEGLRRTGGALSQLGMGEVGGLVSRAGDVAQIAKEFNQLTEALGPLGLVIPVVAGGFIGFQGAMLLMHDQAEKNNQLIKQTIATLDTYYSLINEGTTESLKARQTALQKEKEAVDKELSVIAGSRDNAFVSAQKAYGDLGARLLYAAGQTGLYGDTLKDTGAKVEELRKKSMDLGGQLDGVNAAMKSSEVAANDMKVAEEDLAKARRSAIDEGIRAEQKRLELEQTGTSTQVKSEIARLEREQAAIESRRPELLKMLVSESKADRDEAEKWIKLYYDDEKAIVQLKNNVLPLVEAREKEAKAAKFQWENFKANIDRIAKEVNERNARVVDVQQKYENDVAAIEEQALKKRADIEQRYADRLVDIAREAADAAAQALTKLTEERQDLLIGLNRDLDKQQRDAAVKTLDIQISAQREEVKALRDHQREVEQIRKDAFAREVGFLLSRNFRALYESRLQTSRDIERSGEGFSAGRADRQSDLKDQFDDLKLATQRERQERLIAYQQTLQDAQIAYKRELQQAQQKRAAELAIARQEEQAALMLASQAAATELRIRKNAYDQDLRLAAQYGAAYVKTHDQMMQALLQRAEQRLAQINGTSGGSNTPISGDQRRLLQRAGGGPLGAGQGAVVNDGRGRESFNGVPFPPGLGLFIPMQSGTVQPGSKADTPPVTFYIQSNDVEGVRHEVLNVMEKIFR